MKKVIIPQKMSGTGTIHDIASQYCDREIKFPKGAQFAVVLASYYGGKGYATHASESATIQASRRQSEFSHAIIGEDGHLYYVDTTGYYNTGKLMQVSRSPYEVVDFEAITSAAAALGSIVTEASREASRANGRKGGRPRNAIDE